MKHMSISPRLRGILQAIQEEWQHESLSETVATILDAATNEGWVLPVPKIVAKQYETGCMVRIKSRHQRQLSEIASSLGMSGSEIIRGRLALWLSSGSERIEQATPTGRQIKTTTQKPGKKIALPTQPSVEVVSNGKTGKSLLMDLD